MISNIYSEHSVLSDHKYIICETSHSITIKEQRVEDSQQTNLSSFNYLKADWIAIKAKLRELNWGEILKNLETSEEKFNQFLELVTKVVEEHCKKIKQQRGSAKRTFPETGEYF